MSDGELAQLFKKTLVFKHGEPDYSVYEKQLEAIQSVAKINNSSMLLVDLYKGKINFLSKSNFFLPGYTIDDLSNLGPQIYALLKDGDLAFMQAFLKPYIEFRAALPAERRKYMVLSLTNRFTQKDGKKYPIHVQLTPLLFDDACNVWVLLGSISFATKSYQLQSSIDMRDTGEHFEFNLEKTRYEAVTQKLLTPTEKQILMFTSRGYLDKETVDLLNVSINTIKTHKRNILRKLRACNMTEAYLIASTKKLL